MRYCGILAGSRLVAVDETEYAVVTNFGQVATVHGVEPGTAGLHVKGPWQSVLRVDRRLRSFDPPPREVITGDKRNLEVASYLVYRVADPVQFVRGSGTLEAAEARLNERVSAALSDAIGRRDLAALATTDPAKWALDELTRETLAAVAPAARAELGIDVVDLGLRRFNHPLEVRPAVFELIRSERRQVATRLRAEGEAQYTTITSQADRQRDTILAQAEAEAERIRGQAQAESTRILNEAHGRDPKFYELLRTLDSYGSILDPKTTIVLSASSPLLKLLSRGPTEENPAGPIPARRNHPDVLPSPEPGGPTHDSRRVVSLILLASVVAVLVSGVRMVRPGERIVVRRFGRIVEPAWGPGLHWGLPLGLDRFDRVRTDEVRQLSLGGGETGEVPDGSGSGEFLTGDLNLVRVQAVVQYRVARPADLVVRSVDAQAQLGRLAEASLSRSLARRGVDPVLRSDRGRIGDEVERELTQAVDRHRLGLQILGVSLTDARPPAEVAADFAAAQSAESSRDRRITDARTEAETRLTAARASAQSRLETARTAAQNKLVASRAEAEQFLALLAEARRARALTCQRVYLDAMTSLLTKVHRKVVLPPGDSVDLTVLGIEE